MTRWTGLPDEYADPHGDLLARVLHDEAQTIVPAGDGLARIRGKVAVRRARSLWLRPTLAVATAGLLAVGAFAGFQLSGGGNSLRTVKPPASQPAGTPTGASSTSQTAGPSPSPSPSAGTAGLSTVTPIWPFASVADARAAAQQAPTGSWHFDPAQTALRWLATVVPGEPFAPSSVVSTNDGGKDVAVTDGTSRTVVTTVHVVPWGGSAAAYEVTAAVAPHTSILRPAPGHVASSPLTVQLVSAQGVDESFEVTVWNGTGDRVLGRGHIMAGQGPANGSVTFTGASASAGFVTFLDRSASGSGITRLAAVALRFGGPGAVTAAYPPTFVAVKDGRVAVFYSKGGGFVRYLTPAAPGGGAQAVQLTDDRQWVYYTQGAGSCAADLWRVRYDGSSAPEAFLSPQTGPVTAFALSADQKHLAYTVNPCSGGGQYVVWRDLAAATQGSIHMQAIPPLVLTLSWAPDDRHLAVTFRTGMQWGASLIDTHVATSSNDVTGIQGTDCASGACSAPVYAPDGSIVYAVTDGTTLAVYRLAGGSATQLFSVPSNATVPSLDLTADGTGVIVSDLNGSVWRWTQATGVQKISVTASDASW